MKQDIFKILPNKPNLLSALPFLFLISLTLPICDAAESPFRAQGRITTINFQRNGDPVQTNVTEIKIVFSQPKWCMIFSSMDWQSESALYFDGRNQHVVSRDKRTDKPNQTLHGYISAEEVPFGEIGQVAWFHFCRQRWNSLPRDSFPNLYSYGSMRGVNNLHLTLTNRSDGFDAALDYLHDNNRWPVEKWHAENVDTATGVPKRSERVIYSRIGVFLNDKLITPTPGRVFDKTLQLTRTEVSSIEIGEFPNDLAPTWHTNRTLSVTDKRFSTNDNFLSYTWTNGFPTERQIWADPYQRKQIQAILGVSKQDVR